jgi:L-ascorbate metabolism protein UlaG (beta-lactamase superfamily)
MSAPLPPKSLPRLTHLNADTSWLLQLPNQASRAQLQTRKYYNILIDPWLSGSQVDIASWFSIQWHSTIPFASSFAAVSALALKAESRDIQLEQDDDQSVIDAVFVAHEFTDHCHEETLLQVPSLIPVFAVPVSLSAESPMNL